MGSALLNSGIRRTNPFLTLVRFWTPQARSVPLPVHCPWSLSKLVTSCDQRSLVEGTPLSTLPCMVEGRELTLLFLGIVIPVGTWAEHRVCLECAGTVTEPASWASPARVAAGCQDACSSWLLPCSYLLLLPSQVQAPKLLPVSWFLCGPRRCVSSNFKVKGALGVGEEAWVCPLFLREARSHLSLA